MRSLHVQNPSMSINMYTLFTADSEIIQNATNRHTAWFIRQYGANDNVGFEQQSVDHLPDSTTQRYQVEISEYRQESHQ